MTAALVLTAIAYGSAGVAIACALGQAFALVTDTRGDRLRLRYVQAMSVLLWPVVLGVLAWWRVTRGYWPIACQR